MLIQKCTHNILLPAAGFTVDKLMRKKYVVQPNSRKAVRRRNEDTVTN